MRHWTEQERITQSLRIRTWKPWLKAGVKTHGGKQASRMNALKHGAYDAEMMLIRRYITHARRQRVYAVKWYRENLKSAPPTRANSASDTSFLKNELLSIAGNKARSNHCGNISTA